MFASINLSKWGKQDGAPQQLTPPLLPLEGKLRSDGGESEHKLMEASPRLSAGESMDVSTGTSWVAESDCIAPIWEWQDSRSPQQRQRAGTKIWRGH